MISSSLILESPNLYFIPFHPQFQEPITNAFTSPDVHQFMALSDSKIQEFIHSLNDISFFPEMDAELLQSYQTNFVSVSQHLETCFVLRDNGFSFIELPETTELKAPWNEFLCSKSYGDNSISDKADVNKGNKGQSCVFDVVNQHDTTRIPDQIWWCLIDKETHQLIGMAGLIDLSLINQKAECACWLLPNYRGKGYLTDGLYGLCYYGFQCLKLHRLEGYIITDNSRCKRSILKTPFLFEGFLKDFEFIDNKFYSYNLYSMINPAHADILAD